MNDVSWGLFYGFTFTGTWNSSTQISERFDGVNFNAKLGIFSYVKLHMYSILVVEGNLVFAKELGDEITT